MKESNAGRIIVLITLVALAIGAIAYFLITSNRTSGTVDTEVKQMKPGARSRGH